MGASGAQAEGEPHAAEIRKFTVAPAVLDPKRGPAELALEIEAVVSYLTAIPGSAAPRPPLGAVAAHLSFAAVGPERAGIERPGGVRELALGEGRLQTPASAAPPPGPQRLLVPANARFSLALPELPAGKQVVRCRIVARWPALGGRVLSAAADAPFTMSTATSRPGPPPIALELTSLRGVVPPGARGGIVRLGSVNLPYTLTLTNLPTLSAFGPQQVRPRNAAAAGRIALPLATPAERALREMPVADLAATAFLPVTRLAGGLLGDPVHSARLLGTARGVMDNAARTDDEERRAEGFDQAGRTALDAVRFDPHELAAYATAAHALALGRDGATAAELFFSLLFRMRTAERILGVIPGHAVLSPWYEAVARAYARRLPWYFWPSFGQSVELLGLSGAGLDLDFPRLKRLGEPSH